MTNNNAHLLLLFSHYAVCKENFDFGLFDMSCDVDGCTTVFTSLSNARIHYLNVHTMANGYIKCCNMKLRFQTAVKDHIAWHKDPASFK